MERISTVAPQLSPKAPCRVAKVPMMASAKQPRRVVTTAGPFTPESKGDLIFLLG